MQLQYGPCVQSWQRDLPVVTINCPLVRYPLMHYSCKVYAIEGGSDTKHGSTD